MSMIGKTLGNFQCTALLGKGGMGEVYRAKDQKLGRDVAIKVLPEEFAKDADRVARFQREAKLLASLNHPNIAAIHGLEEANGTHFLVLELIEGDTLADRIKGGPVPVEESLKLALQIAEALEAAHEKGVIHRDLKPANIKVTPDRKVKVLDFGLAKAFAGDQEVNLSNSPTLSEAATLQGVILGTAAYMSPEQARGKPVDKRTDIWAFGCVLYEMLTGKAAFQGEDVTEILAAVVKSGVDLDLLPENLHPDLRKLFTRCLQKDQKRRYSGISDVQYEIEQVLADPSGIFVQPVTAAKPRKKLRVGIPWLAAAIVLSLIVAGVAGWILKPSESKQVMRFDYELPEGQRFSNWAGMSSLAISPNGKQIVYSTPKGLYLRSIDELSAKLIVGTEGITAEPFFSPDGQWIGYISFPDGQLKKISVNGGAPVTLCSIPTQATILGASWSADNTIVYGQAPGDIMRVSANSGTPESIVKAKSVASIFPHILPDGKSVLYTDAASQNQGIVMIHSLDSGETKELFPGAAVGYLPTGHIVYGLPTDDNLYAIPFDLNTLKAKGGPVPLVEGVMGHGVQCAVSDAGTLVYMPGTSGVDAAVQRNPVWVDRKGKEEPIAADPDSYRFPSISPDGTKVALTVGTGSNEDIWILDLVHKNRTRLTFDEARDRIPLWTPDDQRIAFLSLRGGKPGIYWKKADGTGTDELLVAGSGGAIAPRSWSGDGKTLVYMEAISGDNTDIGSISMEGDHAKKELLHDKYPETDPRISPDGRWVAYSCNNSGQFQIYVRPYPEVDGGKWQVSTDGGVWPLWSPDGRELFYRNEDKYMAVPVKTEPTFSFETPKVLFQGTYDIPGTAFLSNWDISPDGKRFLMIKSLTAPGSESTSVGPRKINIVLNWFEELKERAPVD